MSSGKEKDLHATIAKILFLPHIEPNIQAVESVC